MNDIVYYAFLIVGVVIALTVHEFSHAYAAHRLGDPTPRMTGRLSLNPLQHLDPIGALAMLLFHVGWAKPVMIDPRYFRHPRRDMAITGAAGPLSNILLAFFTAPIALFCFRLAVVLPPQASLGYLLSYTLVYLAQFLLLFISLNLSLAIFNLLPIHPLDGSRILYPLLPRRALDFLYRNEKTIYIGFIVWLLLGDRFAAILLRIPAVSASPILSVVASFFSLTHWIGMAAAWLSGLILDLWALIPFLS